MGRLFRLRRFFFLLRLRRCAAEYADAKRRQLDRDGIFLSITFLCLRGLHTRIDLSASAELLRIAVENLFVFSLKRYADHQLLMQLRGKVADKEQCLIRAAPEKCNNIVRCIHAVDPLEAFRLIIFLIECRMAGIKVI